MATRQSSGLSDAALYAGCIRGDQKAWNALIDRYAGLIYSIPLKYGLSEQDCADIFQSVCVTLLEKLGTIRDPDRLPAWLITTTTRQCWAFARTHAKATALASPAGGRTAVVDDAVPMHEPVDLTLLPEEEVLAWERRVIIQGAIQSLPEPCRQLVEALFSDVGEKLSYRALADSLGMPLNSLGPTRSRCLARLKKLLLAADYRF
ncbi:MAG TPA: sigma-70 family RNA polymerase sigma factor [Chloroflexota bacterium]|nr:sigma-70 family RNA polymerase sigma factor [Chloroflexota bacterium]